MIDQMFDSFRRAAECSMQMQQDMLRSWTQQLLQTNPATAVASTDWGRSFQRRWLEFTRESLDRQRETIDSTYRKGIEVIEQTLSTAESASPEEQRRLAEDVWRKLFDTIRNQNESQFHEFQKWTEKSFEIAQSAAPGQ